MKLSDNLVTMLELLKKKKKTFTAQIKRSFPFEHQEQNTQLRAEKNSNTGLT